MVLKTVIEEVTVADTFTSGSRRTSDERAGNDGMISPGSVVEVLKSACVIVGAPVSASVLSEGRTDDRLFSFDSV